MISGWFGDNGELWFEVELVAATGERFAVDALLDTGFTTGFLAISSQDLAALQWRQILPDVEMRTPRGDESFDIYEGRIIIGGEEVVIPVHAAEEVPEHLIGAQWLEVMELIVNKRDGILILSRMI